MRLSDQTQQATLQARRLRLARLAPAHAPALFPLLNDWDVVSMLAEVRWPVRLKAVEAFAAASAENAGTEDFAILSTAGPIGCATLKRPGSGDPPRVMPRLGYWIGRRYWNQGYATEAVAALVDHAFLTFPQNVVGAGVFVDNPASRRVLEKLGFAESSCYRLHCQARDADVSAADMRLARETWNERRNYR